ncbi:recombinase family protein [Azospirillum melinis]
MAIDPLHADPAAQIDLEESLRPRLIGYARTSTEDQVLDLQLDALPAAGCAVIHTDQLSGARVDRPGLRAALTDLRPGDTLCLWRLDRLGRSVPHILETVTSLLARGVRINCLTGINPDPSDATGKLILTIFAALSEWERDLARERIVAGMGAAKRRGVDVGRKPRFRTAAQRDQVKRMVVDEGMTYADVAARLGVSPSVVWRAVNGPDKPAPAPRPRGRRPKKKENDRG